MGWRRSLPTILTRDIATIFAIGGIALGAGLAINHFRNSPLDLPFVPRPQRIADAVLRLQSGVITNPPSAAPAVVTAEYLLQLSKSPLTSIFDARPEIFYQFGHVPGALSLPREDFEAAYKRHQERLAANRDHPIVVYCSDAACIDASLVAEALASLGYANVAVFPGGWAEWEKNQWPVESQQ